jgi:hypothetical protein
MLVVRPLTSGRQKRSFRDNYPRETRSWCSLSYPRCERQSSQHTAPASILRCSCLTAFSFCARPSHQTLSRTPQLLQFPWCRRQCHPTRKTVVRTHPMANETRNPEPLLSESRVASREPNVKLPSVWPPPKGSDRQPVLSIEGENLAVHKEDGPGSIWVCRIQRKPFRCAINHRCLATLIPSFLHHGETCPT